MRASLRWMGLLLAGGLLLAPAAALAQSTTAQETPPTSNSIGPSELQNFSLKGSVTRPADQQPTSTPTPRSADRTAAEAPPSARATTRRHAEAPEGAPARPVRTATRTPVSEPVQSSSSAPSLTSVPDPVPTSSMTAPAPQPSTLAPPPPTSPSEPLVSEHKLLLWPWLLAAVVIAGAVAFLVWRRRPSAAFAGGAEFDLFAAPEPAPAPPPRRTAEAAPAPPPPALQPRATAPGSSGIVSTRLRPQIEIAVQPLRCRIDEQQLVLDFEIELFNAGAAPARSVTAEASLFNAGPTQDQELAAFFANPAGAGDRLEALAPMSRVSFTSQVVAPRSAIQEYELAGRKALVPVIAFNALYSWSGRPAQTSAAYLVGRETKSDKLGPLGVNGVPREFRSLALRALPTGLRT